MTLSALVEEALELHGDERSEFIERLEREQPELGAELRQLVDAMNSVDDFAAALSSEVGVLFGPRRLSEGESLGRWRVEEVLGWGGMGVVYRARRSDAQFEQSAAIKMLMDPLSSEADRTRFLDERQILAGLEHPAIARLIDGGLSEEGHPYYVLELVEGQQADVFADHADAEAILAVFEEICEAVAYAHTRLVVHCDLKPANVLVTPSGRVKLLDFGVARRTGERGEAHLGYLRMPVTRNYAAPELLTGEGVDTRSDVYSLGVLLFRLMTGRQPYLLPAGTLDDLRLELEAIEVRRVDAGALLQLRPLARAELWSIIEQAIAREPRDRTASVGRLLDQVRRLRQGRALDEAPAGVAAYRLRTRVRRSPWVALLGTSTALLAVLGTIVLAVAFSVTSLERSRAEAALQDAEAVIALVVDVFEDVSPHHANFDQEQWLDGASPRPATTEALVQAAADRVLGGDYDELARPELLQFTVGRLAVAVGDFDRADALLAAALQSSDAELRRNARVVMGMLQGDAGQEEIAEGTLTEAIETCRAAGDAVCELTALAGLASVRVEAGNAEAALDLFERAQVVIRAEPSAFRDPVCVEGDLLFGRALAYHRVGDYSSSKQMFEEATDLLYRCRHATPYAVAMAELKLADFRRMSPRPESQQEALELLRSARQLLVDWLGERHPRVAYADLGLCHVLGDLDQLDEALDACARSLDVRMEFYGPAYRDTVSSTVVLATRLNQAERFEEAAQLARDVVELRMELAPGTYGLVMETLAVALHALGEDEEALPYALERLENVREIWGPDHARAAWSEELVRDIRSQLR
ncbi:MAG: serine/threonine-protein kinase [Myxococcales bacterium]|nr:serine/threonine-protein kinase [Myxococcales bacterium]